MASRASFGCFVPRGGAARRHPWRDVEAAKRRRLSLKGAGRTVLRGAWRAVGAGENISLAKLCARNFVRALAISRGELNRDRQIAWGRTDRVIESHPLGPSIFRRARGA
jgi:hypothetical protein